MSPLPNHAPFSKRLCTVLLILMGVFCAASAAADTTVSGPITTDTTWTTTNSPYILTSEIVVQGATGLATLTIEPGVQVRFNSYAKLRIGSSSGNPGALVARGDAGNPIVFTSNNASPAPGNWRNIAFENTSDDATCVMEHCLVEYGGNPGVVSINNALPAIRNNTIRHGSYTGIFCFGCSPTLSGNTIENCNTNGIRSNYGAPVISGTTFSGNGAYDVFLWKTTGCSITGSSLTNGVFMEGAELDNLSNNTISYNNNFPFRIVAGRVGQLISANTVSNTDSTSRVEVIQDTIEQDAVWTSAFQYQVLGNVAIKGAAGPATLTIEPGVQMHFNANAKLVIGGSSGTTGALVARGTAADQIVFTSSKATPDAGDWTGIEFSNTTDDAVSIMEHCLVEYAGAWGAVSILNASPTLKNSTVRYNSNNGLYSIGSGCANAVIQCNTFYMNGKGIQWKHNPPAILRENNFIQNTTSGLFYEGAELMNAENNWWNDPAGPNTGGDAISGNVDADPWSSVKNQCGSSEPNQPPYAPSTPTPADGAVRVPVDSGVALSWNSGDPNPTDVVVYDFYWGASPETLSAAASDLSQNTYTKTPVDPGATFYWKIVARDDKGAQTPGPVWRFTTAGDPPDLVVSALAVTPPGNLPAGQSVTFTATVQNSGSGPVVDPFSVAFTADATSIGAVSVNQIIAPGQSIEISQAWTYAGGDPVLAVTADSQGQVDETREDNNTFSASFNAIADNTPPALVSTSPPDGSHQQQIQQITATLADSQGQVDAAAVAASLRLANSSGQPIAGSVTHAGDTFTFTPDSLPLADSVYQFSLTAADTYGNTRNLAVSFTIDTQPPAKPGITGGTATSGTIQPRPVQNSADQFIVDLTGTREAGTSVWVNGIQMGETGDGDWSARLTLQPGANALEVWLKDRAGNQGPSEWVDIDMTTATGSSVEYDASGRIRRISDQQP